MWEVESDSIIIKMQNRKVETTMEDIFNKKLQTIVQEKKVDKSGDMGSYHEESGHSSDEADPTSQSEESHLSMITYSYPPAPAPGGSAVASSI